MSLKKKKKKTCVMNRMMLFATRAGKTAEDDGTGSLQEQEKQLKMMALGHYKSRKNS